MIHLKRCIAVLLLLSTVASTSVEAQSGFYVRLGGGVAMQSLDDWNDDIRADEAILRNAGLAADFETMGVGIPLAGEIGMRVTELINVGLLVSHQGGGAENGYADAAGSITIDQHASVTSIGGAIGAAVGPAGFRVGADLGVALGKADYEVHFRDFTDPANDFDIDGEWDGNGFTGAVYFGFERFVSSYTLLFARLGYRLQNLGKLDGGYTSPQFGSQPGPPQSNAGQSMDTDLSGLFLLVGIGFGG